MAPAASRTAPARPEAPAISVTPSWAMVIDSIATALCWALSCGATYFSGRPRRNYHTVCC